MTAVQVDPSGNLWVTNNWKIIPIQNNPGGESIMIFIGIAAPIATLLIGPPRQPTREWPAARMPRMSRATPPG